MNLNVINIFQFLTILNNILKTVKIIEYYNMLLPMQSKLLYLIKNLYIL